MEDKLRKLMKQEGINSTRLAEMLGIQASGISHIMSGRNKPSYDFITKLLSRFPEINPDWLLLDKGPMYRDEIKNKTTVRSNASIQPISGINDNLFSNGPEKNARTTLPASPMQQQLERDDADIIPAREPATLPYQAASQISSIAPSSSIERIVVFYKDKTFTEYHPE